MKLRPMALDDLFFDDELEVDDEQEQQQQKQKGSTFMEAMDVDELEAFKIFGKGGFSLFNPKRLADANFFNAFEDDFDDADIN